MSSPKDERNWVQMKNDEVSGLEESVRWQQEEITGLRADAVFHCPNCGAVQGTTNGSELTVGALIINSSVKLTCVACRTLYEWHPEPTAGG